VGFNSGVKGLKYVRIFVKDRYYLNKLHVWPCEEAMSVSPSTASKRHCQHYILFCNNSPSRSMTAKNPLRTHVCGLNMTCKQKPNKFYFEDAISIGFDTEERP
jgi:hypothetical protein